VGRQLTCKANSALLCQKGTAARMIVAGIDSRPVKLRLFLWPLLACCLMALLGGQAHSQTLTLINIVSGGPGSVSDWSLTLSGGTAPYYASGTSGSSAVTNVAVTPGGTFSLSLANYSSSASLYAFTSLTCSGAADTSTSLSNPAITVQSGENVTCTFTNTFVGGVLTLTKQVIGGSAAVTEWDLYMQGAVPNGYRTGMTGDATITSVYVAAGSNISIGEYATGRGTNTSYTYTLANISCNGSDSNGSDGVTLLANETVTCTLLNTLGGAPGFSIGQAATQNPVTSKGTQTYSITIANTGGMVLTVPTITFDLTLNGQARTLASGPSFVSGDTDNDGQLDLAETWIYQATYVIEQADLDAGGSFSSTAVFDTAETNSQSSPLSVAISQQPQLSIDKSASLTVDAGVPGKADTGDVISYAFTVSNNGNITINNVTVGDSHNGYGTPPVPGGESGISTSNGSTDSAVNGVWDVLRPGDTISFSAQYTAVQSDVDYLQ
jgi:hypothetical protein